MIKDKMTSLMVSLFAVASLMVASAALATEEEAINLIDSHNCRGCHKTVSKKVGPAFSDIAKKYKGEATAAATLETKILSGGRGVWGRMPMPEYKNYLTPKEAKVIVTYILSMAD